MQLQAAAEAAASTLMDSCGTENAPWKDPRWTSLLPEEKVARRGRCPAGSGGKRGEGGAEVCERSVNRGVSDACLTHSHGAAGFG